VALRLLLLDKSAYVRGGVEPTPDDELCLCAVTRLEVLSSARSRRDFGRLEDDLAEFRDLRMDSETCEVALAAQRDLAAKGHHRVPIPDLLIASCAQQHGADVVHVDRHYDALARVLTFNAVRVSA
jgi:predicted nucleic acid-binding protein